MEPPALCDARGPVPAPSPVYKLLQTLLLLYYINILSYYYYYYYTHTDVLSHTHTHTLSLTHTPHIHVCIHRSSTHTITLAKGTANPLSASLFTRGSTWRCVRLCVYVCVSLSLCLSLSLCVRSDTKPHESLNVYVRQYLEVCVRACECIHARARTHTHTYVRI